MIIIIENTSAVECVEAWSRKGLWYGGISLEVKGGGSWELEINRRPIVRVKEEAVMNDVFVFTGWR